MNSSDKSQKLSSFFSSRQNIYSVYVLLLFLITYLLNQLDRYMLAIVTKPLAQASIFFFAICYEFLINPLFLYQEIHYGDLACMTNTSATLQTPQRECQKLTNESRYAL